LNARRRHPHSAKSTRIEPSVLTVVISTRHAREGFRARHFKQNVGKKLRTIKECFDNRRQKQACKPTPQRMKDSFDLGKSKEGIYARIAHTKPIKKLSKRFFLLPARRGNPSVSKTMRKKNETKKITKHRHGNSIKEEAAEHVEDGQPRKSC